MNRAIITLLVGAMVLLAGCTGADTAKTEVVTEEPETTTTATVVGQVPHEEGIVRVVDREAGVVCYGFSQDTGYDGQGGLSCMPIEETNL